MSAAGRRGAPAALLLAGLAGCLGPQDEGTGRLGFALSAPAAEATEITSVGLFAVEVDFAEFQCAPYLEGAADPIASNPESVVAAQLEHLGAPADGERVVFSGIPAGRWAVLVECYDARGRRIFLGCGEARVEVGRTAALVVEMREDPLVPD